MLVQRLQRMEKVSYEAKSKRPSTEILVLPRGSVASERARPKPPKMQGERTQRMGGIFPNRETDNGRLVKKGNKAEERTTFIEENSQLHGGGEKDFFKEAGKLRFRSNKGLTGYPKLYTEKRNQLFTWQTALGKRDRR